ncbi:MAG: chemotaxis signal transduction protein [Glaciecola sp.]|jgi:chemotaxis signal transduction protein
MTHRHLLASVAGVHCAIPVEQVEEVINLALWTPLFEARPSVLGLLDVHGTSVPLVDVQHWIGEGSRAFVDGLVVLTRSSAGPVALLFDSVTQVIDATADPASIETIRDNQGALLLQIDVQRLLISAWPHA